MDQAVKKKLVFSSLFCLFPPMVGCILWAVLPEKLVQNIGLFGMFGLVPKAVVVFALPAVFLAIHLISCLKPDWLNLRRTVKSVWLLPLVCNLVFAFSCALGFAAVLNG